MKSEKFEVLIENSITKWLTNFLSIKKDFCETCRTASSWLFWHFNYDSPLILMISACKKKSIAHIYMIKWPYCSLMTQRNTYSLMKFMLQITSFKLYVNEIPFRTTDNKPTYVLGCGSLLIDTTTVWVCSVLDYSLRSNLCLWHLVLTKTRWLEPNCATRGFRMVVHKPNHSDHVYFYTQSLDQRHKMISDKITLLFFLPA